MKYILSLLLLFSLASAPVLTFTGCKTSQQVAAYKTLASVQVAVDEARKAFLDAHGQGKVTKDMVAKALDANAKFHAAFQTAVSVAKSTQDPSPSVVTAAANEFISLVYTFLDKKE